MQRHVMRSEGLRIGQEGGSQKHVRSTYCNISFMESLKCCLVRNKIYIIVAKHFADEKS